MDKKKTSKLDLYSKYLSFLLKNLFIFIVIYSIVYYFTNDKGASFISVLLVSIISELRVLERTNREIASTQIIALQILYSGLKGLVKPVKEKKEDTLYADKKQD